MAKRFLEFEGKTFEIAYEMLHREREEWIVFLHGWGSNKELMKQAFGKVLQEFNHLYIDLPGFGQSYNQEVLDTQKYVQILQVFFESLNLPIAMIVGHSFGGKVATLLSPKELVLLSSAGIVCPKSFKVKAKIRLAKCLKFLGISLNFLRSKDAYSLNEGMYQTFKNVVDEDFTSIFASSTSKAYIFWGKEDKATPLSSGEKIHSLIKNSFFLSLEGDHFFFLHHAQKIEDCIRVWRQSIG